MTTLLILEGNPPDMVATGNSASVGFIRSFLALAPTTELRIGSPYAGPLAESSFDGVDGIVFTGSGTSWATDAAEAAPQRAAMEVAFGTGLPVWGSCNGMQLAAVVLGGAVGASPRGLEVGLARDTQLTDAGRAHPMMAERRDGFAVPCVHRDEVQRLPEGATLIAGNAHSPVQAMAYAAGGVDFWGVQYHPELAARDIATYVRARGVFESMAAMAEDLEAADTDDAVAARLGFAPGDLALENRARELVNWLAHVEANRDPG